LGNGKALEKLPEFFQDIQWDGWITGVDLGAVTRVQHPCGNSAVDAVGKLAIQHIRTCLLDASNAQSLSVKRVPTIENSNVSNPMGIT
jgi:hypothetical protein